MNMYKGRLVVIMAFDTDRLDNEPARPNSLTSFD